MNKQKSYEDVKEYVTRISIRNGWKLNSDKEQLDDLITGLQANFNRLGYYNCPCRDSQEDHQLDRDIICPCRYAEQDIKDYGYCYCTLYQQLDFDISRPLRMIPERRP
ncbi:MAG: ferredoxin:thioredoxin reductase [Candidatus Heimdallarchaeota archaeon]|nr:MAG: ferredoxin:thioredoxin reductase [Candidatus Heimdallarchaeota archaeon]